jgi:heat shock protein HslJ
MRHSILVLAALSALMAACGGSSARSGGSSPAPPSPASHTYESTAVTGLDLHGAGVTLAFGDNGNLSANAGCNTMSGRYSIADGRLVVDGPLASTLMGCPGRDNNDAALSDFLTSRPSLMLKGDTLTLAGASVSMTLVDRAVAHPAKPLAGTKWVADTLYDGDTVSSAIDHTSTTLQIDGSKATGKIGCNSYGADVVSTATTLSFTDFLSTRIACPFSDTGSRLSAMLGGDRPVRYSIEGDQLTLTGPNGEGIGFHASA